MTSSRWPDTIDEILDGDHVVMLAYVTPASGVVFAPGDQLCHPRPRGRHGDGGQQLSRGVEEAGADPAQSSRRARLSHPGARVERAPRVRAGAGPRFPLSPDSGLPDIDPRALGALRAVGRDQPRCGNGGNGSTPCGWQSRSRSSGWSSGRTLPAVGHPRCTAPRSPLKRQGRSGHPRAGRAHGSTMPGQRRGPRACPTYSSAGSAQMDFRSWRRSKSTGQKTAGSSSLPQKD